MVDAMEVIDRLHSRHVIREKRESWLKFGMKGVLVLLLMWVAAKAFSSRFFFAFDMQEVRCIPAYRLYLVDTGDTTPKRDAIFVVASKDLRPFYEKGTRLMKYMRGLPGDQVKIENSQIYVNDQYAGWGLPYAESKLGKKESDFYGNRTLADNEFWFMGTSTQSFDARYWGTLPSESIIGHAYPIL